MAEKQFRFDFLDVAKGIGMIFVVFAHVNYTPELLVPIYSFHMPLFFIISGMLFNGGKYGSFLDFLKRRFRTLILPYLMFSFLAVAYVFISERMFPEIFDVSRESYLKFLQQIFLARGSSGTANVPLWFVPCLLAVEILYYFISKLDTKVIIPLVVLLAGAGWLLESGLLNFDNKLLPWTLDSALFALSFYALGNLSFPLVKKSVRYISDHRHKWVISLEVILLSFIMWLPLTLINGKVSLGSRVLGNGVLFFMTGVLGTVIILTIGLLGEKSRFFRFCGRNSFTIMAVHYVIRRYTVPKIYEAFGMELYDKKSLAETVLPFLMVLVLSLIFTVVYNYIGGKLRARKLKK